MNWSRSPLKAGWVLALAASLLLAACGGADAPSAGGDPVLESGRDIWVRQCSSCHGAAGGGGRGTQLSDGAVLESLTEEEEIAVITDGRASMPSFSGRLSGEEIEAVAAYTREILAVTP